MPFVTWSFPTQIVFGAGALSAVVDASKRLGRRALVVTDPGIRKSGLLAKLTSVLDAGGVPHEVFDAVDPNPVDKNVADGVLSFREAGADHLIAFGGGAPLDTAKLIGLKATHDRPLVDYDDATGGDRFVTAAVPPIVAIPTTAGTGSEVGRSGVVTLAATGRKTVIFSPYLLAKTAILDPQLTVSMPPRVTAATGFDALTHCLEAYVSVGDHPMADAVALGGLELVGKSLVRAITHGEDIEARGGMMKAAMMGAVAFQKGLGACHSLAHPLSSEKGLHHGLANALCLPAVVRWNEQAIGKERLGRIASALGVPADGVAEGLARLREKVGLPSGLEAEGVTEADVPKLAKKAFEDACHRSNPRPVTEHDLETLYRASL